MGTAICGVTAVIAASTIIKSDKNETGYAVGVVTLFGLFAVLCYPYLANYLFNNNNVLTKNIFNINNKDKQIEEIKEIISFIEDTYKRGICYLVNE